MSASPETLNESLMKTIKSYREFLTKSNQYFVQEKRTLAARNTTSNLKLIIDMEAKNKAIQSGRDELKSQERNLESLKEALRQQKITVDSHEEKIKKNLNSSVSALKNDAEKAKAGIEKVKESYDKLQKQVLQAQATLLKTYEENIKKMREFVPGIDSMSSATLRTPSLSAKHKEDEFQKLKETFKGAFEHFRQAASKTKGGLLPQDDIASIMHIKRIEVEEEDIKLSTDEMASQEESLKRLREGGRQLEITIEKNERDVKNLNSKVAVLKETAEKANGEITGNRERHKRLQEEILRIQAELPKMYEEGIEKIRSASSRLALATKDLSASTGPTQDPSRHRP